MQRKRRRWKLSKAFHSLAKKTRELHTEYYVCQYLFLCISVTSSITSFIIINTWNFILKMYYTHKSKWPTFFTWADEWTMKILSAKVCYSIIIVSHQLAVLMGHISSSVAEKKFYFSKLTRETWREVKVGMSLRYVIPYALLVCITLDNIIILYHSRTLRTLN